MREFLRAAVFALLLTGCGSPAAINQPHPRLDGVSSEFRSKPLRWRTKAPNADLVVLALSGGGVKSATFSSEAMFYLQAAGLLGKTRLLSSVSGGGFAAARFALSCDPDDEGTPKCEVPGAGPRPVWRYDTTMRVMTSSLWPMVQDAAPTLAASLVVPGLPTAISTSQYASFVDRKYLGPRSGSSPVFTFRHLDETARPRLALNATLVSELRYLTDLLPEKGYLRRRNGDEFFHFAFTEYFFNAIGSDFGSMPIGYGVAASGAFPALIDYVTLAHHRLCLARKMDPKTCAEDKTSRLVLMDGGANDNQGLIEIYALLGEILLNEARSDNSASPISKDGKTPPPPDHAYRYQPMRPGDKALMIALNSSVTESTGVQNATSPAGLFGVATRSFGAVDVYSGTEVNVRRRLYLASLEEVNQKMSRLNPRMERPLASTEISLLQLDRYSDGGPAAAAALRAGISIPPARQAACDGFGYDVNACEVMKPRAAQYAAWRILREKGTRNALRLSEKHPQCLFEQSKLADGLLALIDLPKPIANCLRHAARWATALRLQELCARPASPINDRAAMSCGPHGLRPPPDIDKVLNEWPEECDFTANSPRQNRTILNHLYENGTFSQEVKAVLDANPSQTADADLGKRLNEVCDLNALN